MNYFLHTPLRQGIGLGVGVPPVQDGGQGGLAEGPGAGGQVPRPSPVGAGDGDGAGQEQELELEVRFFQASQEEEDIFQ